MMMLISDGNTIQIWNCCSTNMYEYEMRQEIRVNFYLSVAIKATAKVQPQL